MSPAQRGRLLVVGVASPVAGRRLSVPGEAAFTLVHDYNGLVEWMSGRWRMKDAVVRDIIAACPLREMERRLSITYHHQRGHQAASFNEWARYTARVDALATQGGLRG